MSEKSWRQHREVISGKANERDKKTTQGVEQQSDATFYFRRVALNSVGGLQRTRLELLRVILSVGSCCCEWLSLSILTPDFLNQFPSEEQVQVILHHMLGSFLPQTRASPCIPRLLFSWANSRCPLTWAGSRAKATASGGLTHLGLLLVQLYLDVCELGPEVFVGSLKGNDECLGLLALISPFLGHCSFRNGVCWFLVPFKQGLPCY